MLPKINITYLHHSGFLLENESCQMLIDFWNPVHIDIAPYINPEKTLYILASHQHEDHFDPEIFALKHPHKIYLLSRLCEPETPTTSLDVCVFLEETDMYQDENLSLQCFGSTDEGVSFYIQSEGIGIFHSGDLNNWHWIDDDETSKAESDGYIAQYEQELRKISAGIKKLDFLLYPLDPRLGEKFYLGAASFIEAVSTNYFIPMHIREAYENADTFQTIARKYHTTYIPLHHREEKIFGGLTHEKSF